MAYQLIYTSYPTSLQSGRSGFSTVARSAEMPEKLAAAVERCGVYSLKSGAVFSHRIISAAGGVWHVLTRVCDSGVDYTNRSNYIAHHIILSAAETDGLVNPAEILMRWEGWVSFWSGEPRLLGNVDGLRAISARASLPAKTWEEIFGDCAYAALLGTSPACIRADASDAELLLRMFSESLLLNVNAADAWNVTFSTSAAVSDTGVMWKGVGAEADGSVSFVADIVSRRALSLPSGRAAEYARSGEMTNREKNNLHVTQAYAGERRFTVVSVPEKTFSPLWIYAASAAFTLLIIVCAVFYAWDAEPAEIPPRSPYSITSPAASGGNSESAVRGFAESLGKIQPAQTEASVALSASQPELPKLSLLQTIDAARAKIEKGEFAEAVALWNSSEYASDNSYKDQVLSDISTKAKLLMGYSERVFSIENASDSEKMRAVENMALARAALDIAGVPDKDKLLLKWETLNGKIKK